MKKIRHSKENQMKLGYQELKNMGEIRARNISATSFGHFQAKKRDVRSLLSIRNEFLLKDLLRLKEERMSNDIFSFYRGSVDLMRMDLEKVQSSNIDILICGDAHMMNFGFYASPERELMFDINDFDEVETNSWENDIKRFLVSALLVSDQLFPEKKGESYSFLEKSLKIYRKSLKLAYETDALNRLLIPNSVSNIYNTFHKAAGSTVELLKTSISKARSRDSTFSVEKYTELVGSSKKFIQAPPVTKAINKKQYQLICDGITQYKEGLPENIQLFLSLFSIVDIVRHTVGVGSVGSRCYLVLLQHLDGTSLILQIKEALPIIRKEHKDIHPDHLKEKARHIIDSQRVLQSASDPFLGAFTMGDKSYYVRQFKDMKGSVNLKKLDWESYTSYVQTCLMLLARAHSQSPNFPMIIGFFEKQTWVDEAIFSFCKEYKKQVKYDYQSFLKEVSNKKKGRW
uniref:DUF2252 domain-containing protein n=1 Tax=Enterococcus faecalis TaxID=1351 RepID=UPI00040BDB51|nr:DUF2252 family protein [Enterococcus faecalis]